MVIMMLSVFLSLSLALRVKGSNLGSIRAFNILNRIAILCLVWGDASGSGLDGDGN